jgi:hypothetical protein
MTGVIEPRGSTGRPTGRVDSVPEVLPGQGREWVESAPEGMAVLGAPFSQQPEGGRRISANRLRVLSTRLSDRDWSVLEAIAKHHFLTNNHLRQLIFADHASDQSGERTCRRVLARLVKERVVEHLERRIGGVRAGSASFVFRVGLVGDQLLRFRSGDGARARRKEPSLRHLDHCLAVADCQVSLVQAARLEQFELLRIDTEPHCWRRYLTLAGIPFTLKPDLSVVTASGDYEDHWFLEVDRGTESLPTVLRQCQAYETYRASGQQALDVFPRVIWVAPDEVRRAKIEQIIAGSRRLDAALFRSCTIDTLSALIAEGAA